jgi:hypothetical protein
MESDLQKLHDKLFSILNEEHKFLFKRIILLHEDREKKLMNDIKSWEEDSDIYSDEVDNQYDQIEALTDKSEHLEELKERLKGRVSKFRSEKKKLEKLRRSLSVSKGIWQARYDEVIEAMEDIYEIGDGNRFKNIHNLKKRLKEISGEFITFCERCDEPDFRCDCE